MTMMRIRIALFAAAFASLAALASAQPRMNVVKLAEGVWAAEIDGGANVGWFLASDGVVVVDSGNDAATAKAVLEKISETTGKPVRYLVLTHAHGDHAGGIPTFAAAGARILCQENAAPAAATLLKAPAGKTSEGVIAISDRMVFFGGARRAAVYFLGAGHTNGDLVVLLPEEKVLFAGDLVSSNKLPYLQSPDADTRGWEQILVRLAALDVAKVVPGHGAVGERQAIGDTLAYVRKVNQVATEFIRTSVPDALYETKLREPENSIENVVVEPHHVANVRAAVKLERARLEKQEQKLNPTPTPAPTKPAPRGKS
ncbi:MAG TPA: MBL fold metallo-hydrolase [Thermoanaerobaculia bacterium]